jgi:CubicO group peptidase (beta-lactamase class C family)
VHEIYRLGINSESRFHIWSATKSFTSTVLGRALHEGVLDSLDHPVERFIKVSGTGYGSATLRHVLMMSSGVSFFHHQGSPDRAEMYRQIWGHGRDLDDFAGELATRVPSGTDFNYLATDTHVLSMVLRALYDQPFHQIVQEQLWDAIGMAGDAFWSQHAPADAGHAFGHACLCPRLLEFAHLGQLYIQDGIWNEKRLLPEGFVAASGRSHQASHDPKEGAPGYGYQWWVPWQSKCESMALGAFGQMIWLDTARGVSIAQFGAQSGDATETTEDTHADMRAIVDAVSP